MQTDVSVILATYNVARYVERAVESVLTQRGVTVEIILVDDHSTDDTWKIVSSMTDPRLTRIRLAENEGPGGARNAGIRTATGTWIAILDGDDAYAPDRLARCLLKAQSNHADIVADNISVRHERDGRVAPMFPPARFARHDPLTLEAFMQANTHFLGGYTFGYLKPVFLRSFMKQHRLRYDAELRIGEDYMILAEALAHGAKCALEPHEGYYYTVRDGSISHRLSLADVVRISEADAAFARRHTLSASAARAQQQRAQALKEAYAFTVFVDNLKQKKCTAALRAISTCPAAMRHLWRPVWARIARLLQPKTRKAPS